MNFVAIDFETANNQRRSACSLGLVVVENGTITEQKYWLIRPDPFEMGHMQRAIHGISLEHLRDKPTFDQVWPEIEPLLRDKYVIAHNAGFDLSVLKQILFHHNLQLPELYYTCTVQLAKAAIREEISYKLSWLSSRLGIELNHHDALSDANACASLLLKIADLSNCSSFLELCNKYYLPPKAFSYFGSNSYKPYPQNLAKTLVAQSETIDPEHILFKKHVAFTGTLEMSSRVEAQQHVVNVGGIPLDGLTKSTNYLVIGNQDFARYGEGFKSSKLKKAEQLIKEGYDLEIIDEAHFWSLLQ